MSKLSEKLQKSKFAVTAELFPPKGTDIKALLEKAAVIGPHVDAINVTDNQRASARLGSMVVSRFIKEKGFEPVMQLTCRDRNRIALQSDLLSASALGIENILILSGDHPQNGECKEAKPVYDLDTPQLISTARLLETGADLSGKKLSGSPKFCIGAVVNPTAEPLDLLLMMLEKKASAGAVFFQTQPIFDVEQFRNFINKVKGMKGLDSNAVKILPGVTLLKSGQFIKFLQTLPGVNIPEYIVKRIESANDQLAEGIKICAETISELKKFSDGIHIMAIGMEQHIPDILSRT